MNYKFYISVLFAMLLSAIACAQPANSSKEKIEAVKIGFITERLDLTSSQAATFWPLYNEYSQKRKDIKTKILNLPMENNLDKMTEEQILGDIKQLQTYRQSETNLDQEYFEKFSKVISLRQIAKLYKAEREFTKILLKKLEEK
jgi:Skp family chaperone for outer membrane proteins